ncbi:hypothetical protein [Pseudogemmobacter bohemicus]|uniref:hypothetical protein n=1 Tax=Pseudogemmobacter bohemicus TaxID=2250708 RepID=UPI000DD31CBD|nr:hypothetical protein [Pseudogemmobacter bohemicus]
MFRIAALMLTLAAVPALAEQKPYDATALATRLWPRDANCAPKLTVQFSDCTASTYYLCPGPGAPVGDQMLRAESKLDDGIALASLTTLNFAFLAVVDEGRDIVVWAGATAAPAPDLQAALDGSAQEFAETLSTYYDDMITKTGITNRLERAGDDVEIDGISFARLTLTSRADDAPEGEYNKLALYYSAELGFPIKGESEDSFAGEVSRDDLMPVSLILPGEDGFEVNGIVTGCEVRSGSVIPEYEVSPT